MADLPSSQVMLFALLAIETTHIYHECVNTSVAASMMSRPQVRHGQTQALMLVSAVGGGIAIATRDVRYLLVALAAAGLMTLTLEGMYRWHESWRQSQQ